MPGAEYGKNKLSYMEDTYLSQSHVGTHIDGMGHIGIKDCYYNQTPMGKYVTQNYLKKLGLETHQDLRDARRHHRCGQGVPGRRQAEDQRRRARTHASTAAR